MFSIKNSTVKYKHLTILIFLIACPYNQHESNHTIYQKYVYTYSQQHVKLHVFVKKIAYSATEQVTCICVT